MNITPSGNILIDYEDTYINANDYNYSIYSFIISSYNQEIMNYLGKDFYFNQMITGQFTEDNIGNQFLIQQLGDSRNPVMMKYGIVFNSTEKQQYIFELSADYDIILQLNILITQKSSGYAIILPTYYVMNYGEIDSLARPDGKMNIDLLPYHTLTIDINGVDYNIAEAESFFYTRWTKDYQVDQYSFILNATITNSLGV